MVKTPNLRIGLFDSGVGGLTVLRQIYQRMPKESVLYFGDTARLPYGTRSAAEILALVREILDWMSKQDVKMIIMACNTSSALALETVRKEYNIPILGLILPGARAAVQRGKRIGVIATPATARSNAYRQAIQEIDPTAEVWQVGCPEFVMLIESNQLYTPYTKQVAQSYLQPLLARKIDTLIYGCTHYRHLDSVFRSILPAAVEIVDPAAYIAIAAEQELELMGLKNNQQPLPTRFCVSGSPQQFAELSQQWLGCLPQVENIRMREPSSFSITLNPQPLDN
ncbi:MAG TPA: glutamate racemase [Xenococcaceae cyanobacterium]